MPYENKHSLEELRQWQQLPLEVKLLMTKERIRQWVNEFGEDSVCVSFSGGKDSTVLLHIVREMYPNVKAVFSNTGLEYPEIQRFVMDHENTEIIRPPIGFKDVIIQFGYPLIGKEVAEAIYYARKLRGADSRQAQSGTEWKQNQAKRTELEGGASQLIQTSTARNRRTVLTGKMPGKEQNLPESERTTTSRPLGIPRGGKNENEEGWTSKVFVRTRSILGGRCTGTEQSEEPG